MYFIDKNVFCFPEVTLNRCTYQSRVGRFMWNPAPLAQCRVSYRSVDMRVDGPRESEEQVTSEMSLYYIYYRIYSSATEILYCIVLMVRGRQSGFYVFVFVFYIDLLVPSDPPPVVPSTSAVTVPFIFPC